MKSLFVTAAAAASAALLALAPQTLAGPTIGNGVLTSGYAPVVKITMGIGGRPVAGCTGTWITARHILTAAHCTVTAQEIAPGWANVMMFDSYQIDGVAITGSVVVNPALGGNGLQQLAIGQLTRANMSHDQAIIEVAPGTAKPRGIYPLAPRLQKTGAPVRLVGFGLGRADYDFDFSSLRWKIDSRDGWDGGEKRTGTNTLFGYESSLLVVRGTADVKTRYLVFDNPDGKRSVPMQGDSGGPLLIERNVGGKPVTMVIGVASAIRYLKDDQGDVHSYYSSVHEAANAAWIRGVTSSAGK